MQNKHLSFEFFPTRTEAGAEKLKATAAKFAEYKPEFFSVTFGAGGSTREKTLETVLAAKNASKIPTAAHFSCIGYNKAEIRELLQTYQAAGLTHLVALRGDIPSGVTNPGGDFNYASELVEFIRAETGEHFYLAVGAYPEYHPQAAKNPDTDFQNFVNKVKAGANCAITQYFYNPDAYCYFLERCQKAGIDIPIYPGIMPITNYQQLARFSDVCGAELPRWIRLKLAAFKEDEMDDLAKFGCEVVSKICERLLAAGAPGLHFYSMNKFEPSAAILKNLHA